MTWACCSVPCLPASSPHACPRRPTARLGYRDCPPTTRRLFVRTGRARFEIHFEKLRNRADGAGSVPFEARLESCDVDGREGNRWRSSDLIAPILKRAAALFAEGLTVREVAASLRISKTKAGRLRVQALDEGLLASNELSDITKATVR
jgi:hypothetical protein